MLGDDFSITNAVLLILTLFTDIGLSYIKRCSPRTANVIDGVPTVLVTDGRYDERVFRGCRLDKDDVLEAARSQEGNERVFAITFAIIEVSGNISIVLRRNNAPAGERILPILG